MTVVPEDVARFLGRADDSRLVSLAGEHLPVVTAFVKAYTRENGFFGSCPNEDIAAVIVSATARLVDNPSAAKAFTSGPFSVTPGTFSGWTLPELAVLHRYRRRTA